MYIIVWTVRLFMLKLALQFTVMQHYSIWISIYIISTDVHVTNLWHELNIWKIALFTDFEWGTREICQL